MNSDDDADDFVFFVKAYSKDSGESVQCQSQSDDIKKANEILKELDHE